MKPFFSYLLVYDCPKQVQNHCTTGNMDWLEISRALQSIYFALNERIFPVHNTELMIYSLVRPCHFLYGVSVTVS